MSQEPGVTRPAMRLSPSAQEPLPRTRQNHKHSGSAMALIRITDKYSDSCRGKGKALTLC